MNFIRKNLYLYVFLVFISCKEIKNNEKQNFVFILVDDLGWTDLGYTGSTFHETPNIDLLSSNSIQFTNAYSSGSVCSPSRASIMTGKHPAKINITDWIPGLDPKDKKLLGPKDLNELPLEEVTIAEVLKNNGYKTFFAGKWHLGNKEFLPENQGFETNIGGNEKGQPQGGYYSPYKNPNLTDGPDGEYLTDRLTDESIKFLNTVTDKPFFLFMSYYTVHTPIQANKRHIAKFKKKLQELENNEISQRAEGEGITTLNQVNPAYASMVYSLDENIGRLIAKLKKEGLYENTTIIFTSDNGGLSTVRWGVAPTSVEPLRAGKGWLYEGGIRVPLLIKPHNYGENKKIISEPVIGHDIYPTILSLAGIKPADNRQIDGIDLTPLLEGNEINREELYWHYPHYHGSAWKPGAAIRQGDWKLIEFYESGKLELYNIANDISETKDLSLEQTKKVSSLKRRLHELQKSMTANKAILNPEFNHSPKIISTHNKVAFSEFRKLNLDSTYINLLNPKNTSKSEHKAVMKSWSEFHKKVLKFIKEEKFQWEVPDSTITIVNKIYFYKNGTIDYYSFKIRNPSVTAKKRSEYEKVLQKFSKNIKLELDFLRDEKYSQCGKTKYRNY